MGFTIPESDYNTLRYEYCGISGVDVVHSIGEELRRRTGRSFEIHFDNEKKVITILDSEDIPNKTLETIFQSVTNTPWTPRIYKSPLSTHSDKQFLLVSQHYFKVMGNRDLKRRKDDASSDEETLYPDHPATKQLRKITNALQQVTTG